MKKQEHRTIVLNGTKLWFWVIGVLLTHGVAGVWGAATIVNKVDNVDKSVAYLSATVETNRKEAKEDIKDLRSELNKRKHGLIF